MKKVPWGYICTFTTENVQFLVLIEESTWQDPKKAYNISLLGDKKSKC
jgi:hypothetical protein